MRPPLSCRLAATLLCVSAVCVAAPSQAKEPLPNEKLTMEPLATADSNRLYLSDPAMGHIVDGRIHVLDGARFKYLGMIGSGFAGVSVLSPDRNTLYVATTYLSRLQRGVRTDMIEAYDTRDLTLRYEIEIPARKAQALPIKALVATTPDGRYLLLQNATPATSITVVDLAARRVAGEYANPGCWGVIPWPSTPSRFSTVCGDGTLATFELAADGKAVPQPASAPFFDPEEDPVFMHYEVLGDELLMLSYKGNLHAVELLGATPTPRKAWSIVDDASRKQNWAPGGYALFALDPEAKQIYVGMHDGQAEGSHKNPAKEIWIIDLASRKRIGRMPGQMSLSMAMSRSAPRSLFLLTARNNQLVRIDNAARPNRKLTRSEPMGETPIYLEMH